MKLKISNIFRDKDNKIKWEYFIPIFLIIITLPLIHRLFTPRNELRYLYIAEDIVRSKNPFVYFLNGKLYTDKPPLYFWLIILSKFLFGNYYTYGLILFNIAVESFALMKLYKFLSRKYEDNTAVITVLMAITGILQGISLIVIRMDIFLSSFITLALINFFECYEENDYRKNYKTFIFIGLGFLFKGIVGILTPLLVIILFKFFSNRKYSLKEIHFYSGLSIILSFFFIWAIPAYLSVGSIFLEELFIKQTFNRTVNAFVHKRPVYYYLFILPALLFPWTVISMYTLYSDIRTWIKNIRSKKKNDDFKIYLLIWILSTFLYLSAASSKLVIYLLPIMTPICILSGLKWKEISRKKKRNVLIITQILFLILIISMFFINSEDFLPFRNISVLAFTLTEILSVILILAGRYKLSFLSFAMLIPFVFCLAGTKIDYINKVTKSQSYSKDIKYESILR